MTTQKLTYVAQTINGEDSRSSASMPYTHAMLVTRTTGIELAQSWHKSQANAEKAAQAFQAGLDKWNSDVTRVRIVAVEGFPFSSPEAKAARASTKRILKMRQDYYANK